MPKRSWQEFDVHNLVRLFDGGWLTVDDVKHAARSGKASQVFESLSPRCVLALVDAFGGTVLYVPGKADARRLSDVIGVQSASLLMQAASGDAICIPRLAMLRGVARRRCVTFMRNEGVSVKRIALHLGVTERYVWGVIADAREAKGSSG